MSLVNDALKKARHLAPPNRSPARPNMRPVDTRVGSSGSAGFWLLILLIAVVTASGSFLWQWIRVGDATTVRARALPSPPVVPSVPVVAQPTVPVPIAPAVPAQVTDSQTNLVSAPVVEVTNAPVVEPAKPVAPAYKLQSVFYRPDRPEAVINGKTVGVGSMLGDAKVLSITQESVSLLTADGKINLLVLP